MKYPQRVIRMGEADAAVVRAVKQQLNTQLALTGDDRLDPDHPRFGPGTRQAVRLFQARHVDADGRPLRQDGEIGPVTWAALFDTDPDARDGTADDGAAASPLTARALALAGHAADRKVKEQPRNSNRGPEVDAYLRRAGAPPGCAWCCAFVYWCMDEAARALGQPNPMVRTAGCLHHWNRAPAHGARRILISQAKDAPSLIQPGMIFIISHGKGLGHTGFVERVHGGLLHTVEGNTDATKTREGGGVYRLTRRIGEINRGFIAY